MRKIFYAIFPVTCLLSPVTIFAAPAAMVKTVFEQNNIGLARASPPADFVECVAISAGLLRCPKSRGILRAQQRGRQKLFQTNVKLPAPNDNFIYAVMSGNCYRIIREIEPTGGGFYGVEVCN